jgi:hypothetical protein
MIFKLGTDTALRTLIRQNLDGGKSQERSRRSLSKGFQGRRRADWTVCTTVKQSRTTSIAVSSDCNRRADPELFADAAAAGTVIPSSPATSRVISIKDQVMGG